MAELQKNPEPWTAAVEEILRISTIIHGGRRRVATEDIKVNGQLIKAGEGMIEIEIALLTLFGRLPGPALTTPLEDLDIPV